MPKQTFLHLAIDKQETLLQAAKKEFSRVPLHDASIANIVKDAGIPRGSFYQYFEDKEDLYLYILNQLSQSNNERFVAILKEKEGDLFETFIDTFQFMIENQRKEKNESFFKNAFLNMNYKLENTLANRIYEENKRSQYLAMIQLINKDNLNIVEEGELHHIIKIITAITFHNLVQMFVKELSEEETLNNYLIQIDLLKRGLYKGESQ